MKLQIAYNAEVGASDKWDYIANFIAIGHLLFHLHHGIEDACLAVENEAADEGTPANSGISADAC